MTFGKIVKTNASIVLSVLALLLAVAAWRKADSQRADNRAVSQQGSAPSPTKVAPTAIPTDGDVRELRRQIEALKKQLSDERDIQLLTDIQNLLESSSKRATLNAAEIQKLTFAIAGVGTAMQVSFENYRREVDAQFQELRRKIDELHAK